MGLYASQLDGAAVRRLNEATGVNNEPYCQVRSPAQRVALHRSPPACVFALVLSARFIDRRFFSKVRRLFGAVFSLLIPRIAQRTPKLCTMDTRPRRWPSTCTTRRAYFSSTRSASCCAHSPTTARHARARVAFVHGLCFFSHFCCSRAQPYEIRTLLAQFVAQLLQPAPETQCQPLPEVLLVRLCRIRLCGTSDCGRPFCRICSSRLPRPARR